MSTIDLGYPGLLHDSWVAARSPDGARVASGGPLHTGGALRVWSWPDGALLHSIDTKANDINTLSWSPDGRRVVAADYVSHGHLLDLTTGAVISRRLVRSGPPAGKIRFSPDGSLIAYGANHSSRKLLLLDGSTLAPVREIRMPDHCDGVEELAFVGGALLAKVDGELLAFDVSTGAPLDEPEAILAPTLLTPDSERVVVWQDGVDPMNPDGVRYPQGVHSLAFSQDGRLACGDATGAVFLFDATTGARLAVLQMDGDGPASVAWSPDGALLACGGGGRLELRDAATLTIRRKIRGKVLGSLAFSADSTLVIAESPSGKLRVNTVANGKVRCRVQTVMGGALSGDGAHLITLSFRGEARCHRIEDGALINALPQHGDGVIGTPRGAAFADGRGALCVLDLITGRAKTWWVKRTTRSALRTPIHATADGKRFAIASGCEPVLIIDREQVRFPPLSRPITAIAVSPDGTWLAAGGGSMLRLMTS